MRWSNRMLAVALTPQTTLTRAAKERAVTEMVDRLVITSFNVANSHDRELPEDPDDRADVLADRAAYQRACVRQQAALVRLAMAATVD